MHVVHTGGPTTHQSHLTKVGTFLNMYYKSLVFVNQRDTTSRAERLSPNGDQKTFKFIITIHMY
jgi:hypothetical protein